MDIYVGQDVKRTMDTPDPANHSSNELDTKIKMSRQLPNIKGNVWWHGYWVTDNYKGAGRLLADNYQSTIALPPAYKGPGDGPRPVDKIKVVKHGATEMLEWDAPKRGYEEKAEDAVRFVVYQFFNGEKTDTSNAEAIVALTPYTKMKIDPNERGVTYAVSVLDRLNRESKPVFLYVK